MTIMRRTLQLFIVAAIIALIIMTWVKFAAAPSVEFAEPGKPAPDFTALNLQGELLRLSDYKGQGVLLNFWASWCTPCVNELPLLNEAVKLTGVELVAINVGEKADTAQKFVDRYELVFPVALDEKMDIKQQYRVAGLPLTVLVDAEGKLVERYEGELKEMSDILHLIHKASALPEAD